MDNCPFYLKRIIYIIQTVRMIRTILIKEIAEKLDKLPDILKEDGYPDVQAFIATQGGGYCRAVQS